MREAKTERRNVMNCKTSRLLAVTCLLALLSSGAPSLAQEHGETKQQTKSETGVSSEKAVPIKAVKLRPETLGQDQVGKFTLLGPRLAFSKLVKGAPYSATAVTEAVQTLSDGNEITHKTEAKIYRDSEGRTRREQVLDTLAGYKAAGDPVSMVFIDDPVAGASLTLDPRSHTAVKRPSRPIAHLTDQIGEPGPGERKPNKLGMGELKPVPKEKMALKEGKAAKGDLKRLPEDSSPRKTTISPDEKARIKPKVEPQSSRERYVVEQLGKQMIEGVEAEGTRSTVTIPAGEIGNRLPIEITEERWYSPDLQILVLRKYHDPRSGDTLYRLTGINRSEPDPSLFQVPAEYRLLEPENNGAPKPKRLN